MYVALLLERAERTDLVDTLPSLDLAVRRLDEAVLVDRA
jgi:hypothetical protein